MRHSHRVVVNSGHRDMSLYPSSNNYTYVLDRAISHVTGVQFVEAEVPVSVNTINASNDTFSFEVSFALPHDANAQRRTVTIPHGMYEVDTLVDQMNARYAAIYPNDDKVSVTTNGVTTQQPAVRFFVLGTQWKLSVENRSATGAVRITPSNFPYVYGVRSTDAPAMVKTFTSLDMLNINSSPFLYLRIPELPSSKQIMHSANVSPPVGIIGRIQMIGPKLSVSTVSISDTSARHYHTTFKPVLNSVTKLTIQWLDRDFNLVDFNGMDHSILLEFEYG